MVNSKYCNKHDAIGCDLHKGLRIYRIRWAGKQDYTSYIVHAKDASDARIMGEVWSHRWNMGLIQSIDDCGEVNHV